MSIPIFRLMARNFAFLFVSTLASSIVQAQTTPPRERFPTPTGDEIPPRDLDQIRHDAAMGHAASSHRLLRYYIFEENNVEEWSFWLRLAAEQGDCTSMREWVSKLNSMDKNPDLAREWAKRVRASDCETTR